MADSLGRYQHERDHDRHPTGHYIGPDRGNPRAEMAVAWDDAEAEALEGIDSMAGEVVSGRVLLLVYGALFAMIALGVAILRWAI